MARTQHPEHREEDSRSARAFRASFRADARSSAEKRRDRVFQVPQAFFDAGSGSWGEERAVVERIERWAVEVRSQLEDSVEVDGSEGDVAEVGLRLVHLLTEGLPGESFLRAGWRAVKKALSVLDPFPPTLDSLEPLGGLAGDAGAGAVGAGGVASGAGADTGDAGAGNGGGDGGEGAGVATTPADPVTPVAGGEAVEVVPVAPTVAQHGGAGGWSHALLPAAGAVARSQAQVDPGMYCFASVVSARELTVLFSRKWTGCQWISCSFSSLRERHGPVVVPCGFTTRWT